MAVSAAPRASADYTLAPESVGGAGGRASSADYTVDHAIGGPGGAVASADLALRGGYAGQLYEVASLAVSASPTTVGEGASRQLAVQSVLDDDSLLSLAPEDVAWSVVSGPLTGIDAAGLATAGLVYEDTPATARATHGATMGDLSLTVLDTDPDNFGSYAGDGIDDGWQVFHFGLDNPLAGPLMDPDGNGQNNLFKFTAGLDPNDPMSRFLLRIDPVPGEPQQRNLIFGPIIAGRSYQVLQSPDLSPASWQPLPDTPPTSDAGDQRTVTDINANAPEMFYRVEIQRD